MRNLPGGVLIPLDRRAPLPSLTGGNPSSLTGGDPSPGVRAVTTDFEALQDAVRASAEERAAEGRACEAFLNALYHAFRHSSGPGLPLNNVSLDWAEASDPRLRPVPPGGWHAAWLRLGLCEVYVRVRREAGHFLGEYGPHGQFSQQGLGEHELLGLARRILRDLTREQRGGAAEERLKN